MNDSEKEKNSHVRRNYIATNDVHLTIGIKRGWGRKFPEPCVNRATLYLSKTRTAALVQEFTDWNREFARRAKMLKSKLVKVTHEKRGAIVLNSVAC